MTVGNLTIWQIALIAAGLFVVFKLIMLVLAVLSRFKMQRIVKITDTETNETSTIPVKRCPFCGKNVSVLFEDEDEEGNIVYLMVCDAEKGGCGSATGQYSTPESAVMGWNKRSSKNDE